MPLQGTIQLRTFVAQETLDIFQEYQANAPELSNVYFPKKLALQVKAIFLRSLGLNVFSGMNEMICRKRRYS